MIVDTPWRTTAKVGCLAANGVGTVIRYYNFSNSSSLPEKRLELAEAEALSAHGMHIGAVFQARQTKSTDFDRAKGFHAGRRAYRYAQDDIGQPSGSCIYFAVDFDATQTELEGNVVPYFEGVKQAFLEEGGGSSNYRIGSYGSGLVCTSLIDKGLTELTWLAMSRGFRGTRTALERGQFNLLQTFPPKNICGLNVDLNEVNPASPDIGTFTLDIDVEPLPIPTEVGATPHRVLARPHLNLRGGPGTEFDVVGKLHTGRVVGVTSTTGKWGRIDLDGDGGADGFAHLDFLEPL